MITITHLDSASRARAGVLHLRRGDVLTPVFMPVGTAATVKAMLHRDVEEIGFGLILANTYHLFLRPGMEVIRRFGGVRPFSGWSGNLLTDSGGFQVFSLSRLRKITSEGVQFRSHIDGSLHRFTPESVVDIQRDFDSDVQMALDVCTAPDAGRQESERAERITADWAARAARRWRETQADGYGGALFGIIQGNFFEDLRRRSAESILEQGLPGVAIGGLSVGEPFEQFRDTLAYTAEFLPPDVPRYLMGIGTPDYILEAVRNGIDMFDCVFPTRAARNGTVFTTEGRLQLKNARFTEDTGPIEDGCGCAACRRYTRGYIRHLFKCGEMLGPMLTTIHNLFFMQRFVSELRCAIVAGRFESFARGYSHWLPSESGDTDVE